MSRTGAVIEARMASTRLPGKVLAEVAPGRTMIDIVVARARRAATLERVVVATTTGRADDALAAHCAARGYDVFRGSEADVLGRSLAAAEEGGLEIVVRLTGDNPFIDPLLLDDLVAFRKRGGYDYAATTMMGHSGRWQAEREFPRGISAEAVRLAVLRTVAAEATDPLAREYPTVSIFDAPDRWRLGAFPAEGRYRAWKQPALRFTVDTPEDLAFARAVLERLGGENSDSFDTGDAIALVAGDAALRSLNASVRHNVISELRASAGGTAA